MDGERFDHVATTLIEQRTRRSIVGFLGAALLSGGGLVALGDAGVEAGRRKRRKKGDRGRDARCRSGKVLQRLQVPADGTPVETKPLAKGERYRLRVSGVIEDDEWGLDGDFYFLLAEPNDLQEVHDACFDGTPVGVEVSGQPSSGWGAYTDDHVYERTVIGKGKPLSLRLSDCHYTGNTGSLKVEVLCG